MKTTRPPSARAFLDLAGKTLDSDEVRYSLMHGIAERVMDNPHVYGPSDPWFLVVEDGDELCAASMRTPPHSPILARFGGDLSHNGHNLRLAADE